MEVHKCYYSIGLVGTYELHVGLRQQMAPLPGSPFTLKVIPGNASAISTSMPPEVVLPLRGVVGEAEEQGCELLLLLRDKMGNACVKGGAKVTSELVPASEQRVNPSVQDNDDGTYLFKWKSRQSGVYTVHVLIDHDPIIGSPFPVHINAATPDLAKTTANGPGLSKAKVRATPGVTSCATDPSLFHLRGPLPACMPSRLALRFLTAA